MNSKNEIIKKLKSVKSVVIFPHTKIDADALGSSIALLIYLREKKIDAKIFYDESIPDNLLFLIEDYKSYLIKNRKEKFDLAILIDSNNLNRITKKAAKVYNLSKETMIIDHHEDTLKEFDFMYAFPNIGSAAEVLFELLKREISEIKNKIDFSSALYAGVMSDTGRFSYKNTRKETFLICAKLISLGAKKDEIYKKLFLNIRISRLRLEAYAVEKMELLYKGKLGISVLLKKDFDKFNAVYDDADAAINKLKMVKGVELVILIKYDFKGGFKVSTRSVSSFDCNSFCQEFGGGGHKGASGFDSTLSIDTLYRKIINNKYLKENLKQV